MLARLVLGLWWILETRTSQGALLDIIMLDGILEVIIEPVNSILACLVCSKQSRTCSEVRSQRRSSDEKALGSLSINQCWICHPYTL